MVVAKEVCNSWQLSFVVRVQVVYTMMQLTVTFVLF
jgi:hypothetical protein